MPTQVTQNRAATIGYVAPFIVFVGLLELDHVLSIPAAIFFPLRFVIILILLLTVARPYFSLKPSAPLASIVVGIAVFLIWIGPDALFGYRHHWLFENSLTGSSGAISTDLHRAAWFIVLRSLSSVALVPVLEELFWRGWMMRWLISNDFQKVPLGKYVPSAFWIVALLFASEHGAFWEVGLAAGIVYNWWLVRTRNLADCIWAHAVTNGLLAVYVVAFNHWQYWL